MTRSVAGTLIVVAALLPWSAGLGGTVAASAADAPGGGGFVAVTPCRVVDSRNMADGALGDRQARRHQVGGGPGAPFVQQGADEAGCGIPVEATAVEASITAISPTSSGFVRAWPGGSSMPNATFMNYARNQDITNTGTIPLGERADLEVRNFGGEIHYVIDIQGYVISAETAEDSYVPTTPCRVVDTRGTIAGALTPREIRDYQISGSGPTFADQGGKPEGCTIPTDATAVEASITAVSPTSSGFFRAWPDGTSMPNATFMNYARNQDITNTGTIPLGNDAMTIRNFGGTAHYVIDIQGYYIGLEALADVVDIEAGSMHTCALLGDGTVQCFGDNTRGQLGDGTTTSRPRPAPVSGLTGAVAISSSSTHTCAIVADGTARCWGENRSGELGDGTRETRLTPVTPHGVTETTSISTGSNHTCAVAQAIVRCWGSNHLGQIGDGTTRTRIWPTKVPGVGDAKSVAVGAWNSCALLADDTLRCWGANNYGQLGDGTTTTRFSPINGPDLGAPTALAGGAHHMCALLADTTVSCWGHNDDGQLGDGTTTDRATPVVASGLTDIVQVSAGLWHTCASASDGTSRCWGRNDEGQLGDGTTTDRASPPDQPKLRDLTQTTSAGSHTCAIDFESIAQCWGYNYYGQLGDGTRTDHLTPAPAIAPQ